MVIQKDEVEDALARERIEASEVSEPCGALGDQGDQPMDPAQGGVTRDHVDQALSEFLPWEVNHEVDGALDGTTSLHDREQMSQTTLQQFQPENSALRSENESLRMPPSGKQARLVPYRKFSHKSAAGSEASIETVGASSIEALEALSSAALCQARFLRWSLMVLPLVIALKGRSGSNICHESRIAAV